MFYNEWRGNSFFRFLCLSGSSSLLSIILIIRPMQKMKGKQQWTQPEKKLLADLFPKYSSKKWKMISLQMAQKGFKRTELECREKWINFLDPSLNNQDWNALQLQRLYNYHDKYGTRWCFMQKELNRTQNRIKNRFYGTIRNYIRLVLNTLCQRNTCFNTEINKISPSLLNDLYNSENIFDFLRGEIKKMIYRMKFKIDKKLLRNRIRAKENLYRELLGLIGSLFKGSFSLRFLDKIEADNYNEEEEGEEGEESIKQIQKQIFIQEKKAIIQQEVKHAPRPEFSSEISLNACKSQKNARTNEYDLVQAENLAHQQSNGPFKNRQYLYATNNNLKTAAPISPQNIKTIPQPNFHLQSEEFYPFINHNPSMLERDLISMNIGSRLPTQFEANYQFILDKIRFQNVLMMQQQQEFLISRIIAQANKHMM